MSSISGTVFNSPLHYSRNLQDLLQVSEIRLKTSTAHVPLHTATHQAWTLLESQPHKSEVSWPLPWLHDYLSVLILIIYEVNYLWSKIITHHPGKSNNCKKVNNINVDLFVITFARKFWSKTITTQIPNPIPRYNPVKHYYSTTTQSENYMKSE